MRRLLLAGLAALTVTAANAQGEPRLRVGMPPPPLKVAKWLKGVPVAKFEPGKVYVVEFWATWCGPCRTTIPHLTELAKKFKGQATVVGVSVFERPAPDYQVKVANFIKEMGPKMDYNVAVDSADGTMGKSWMEASGQGGIPTAFIVGKKSTIEWIGHPMDGMDAVLSQVIAGTFNAKAAAADREKKEAAQAKMQAVVQKIGPLVQQGDLKGAIAELDKAFAADPELEGAGLWSGKFNLLIRSGDEAGASAYAKRVSETIAKDDPQALNFLAWGLIDPDRNPKAPDYGIAQAIAQRAVDLTKSQSAEILDTLAYACFKKGDTARAIQLGQQALTVAQKAGMPVDEYKKHLDAYKAK